MFLKNYWYVCAWDHEVGREPLQRWICGETIVMWRKEDGTAVAIADRCPHRDAPLSLGTVIGDNLQCGYHGLTFDGCGACVDVPGAEGALKGFKTRHYPIVEKWGWLFVWMGDPDKADEAQIPDYHWKDDPAWAAKGETLHVNCKYTLVRDNLLDLSHAHYVHKNTLATDNVIGAPVTAKMEGDLLSVTRMMKGIQPSPFMKKMGGFEGRVDHSQRVEFTPAANIVIKTGVKCCDTNKFIDFRVMNAMTPETEDSTHYFWSLARDSELDDEAVTEQMFVANRDTFFEDVAVIEAQHQYQKNTPAPEKPARWHIDKGVDQVHRWVDRLLKQEAADQKTGADSG